MKVIMNTQTIRVLMVEDDPEETRRIQSLFPATTPPAFTWERVEKLSIARDLLRSEPFDLVLLDLSLPDSQGLDTLRSLYPHAICLPVVIMINSDEEPLALQALEAGAQDYVVKGNGDGSLLARALRHAVERKHIETTLRVKIRELTVVVQQLEQAVRLGHELNNSLATVLLSVEALLAQIPSEDLKHTDLQVVHDEISRMGRFVANLLQLGHRRPRQMPKTEIQEAPPAHRHLLEDLQEHRVMPIQRDLSYFFQTGENGTAGYVLKGEVANELVAMLYRTFQEGVLIPNMLGSRLLHASPRERKLDQHQSDEKLSAPEREVLQLIARGCTNKEIAKRLSISVRTVERHRASIMKKLDLRNRAQLVSYALQRGL
jgi:DNA-binding NarL/FixJ family response regulator